MPVFTLPTPTTAYGGASPPEKGRPWAFALKGGGASLGSPSRGGQEFGLRSYMYFLDPHLQHNADYVVLGGNAGRRALIHMGSKHKVPYCATRSKHKKGGGSYRATGSKQTTNAGPQVGTGAEETRNVAPQVGMGAQEMKSVGPQVGTDPKTTNAQPQAGMGAEEAKNAEPQGGKPERKTKRPFFNVYNIIGIVLCILLLPGFIISSTLLVSSWINSDVPPSCFGFTPLMVETGSMSPVFDENDLVLIHNTDDDATYNVGDIICYHSGGNAYVTHRIKEITTDKNGNTAYITQGDANNAPDQGSVRADQILGVYKTRFEGMGGVFAFMQTPGGMIVCVVLPIVLVLLLFFLPPMLAARKKAEDDADGKDNTEKGTGES